MEPTDRVSVYMPSMDGEYIPVKFTSSAEDLKDTEVLIFLDGEDKHIYIWTGENSNVRKRFISSQIARQMRLEKGMTHRISTEEQGNETKKFNEFIEKIEASPVLSSAPLEVTPPVAAASIDVRPKVVKKPTSPSKKALKKAETLKKISTAPPPPKKVEVSKPPSLEEPSQLYFSTDQLTEVVLTKGKLLVPASNKESTITMLHLSSAATEGRVVLYSLKKKTKTVSCKTTKPIFVVYLSPNTDSVLSLDDLEIPLPAKYSVYYTCPGKTFLGINLE